jgi:hypothetical protein
VIWLLIKGLEREFVKRREIKVQQAASIYVQPLQCGYSSRKFVCRGSQVQQCQPSLHNASKNGERRQVLVVVC